MLFLQAIFIEAGIRVLKPHCKKNCVKFSYNRL